MVVTMCRDEVTSWSPVWSFILRGVHAGPFHRSPFQRYANKLRRAWPWPRADPGFEPFDDVLVFGLTSLEGVLSSFLEKGKPSLSERFRFVPIRTASSEILT